MNASEQEVALLLPELAVAVKYKWLLRGLCLILGAGQGSSKGLCLFKWGCTGSVLEHLPRLLEAVSFIQSITKPNKK